MDNKSTEPNKSQAQTTVQPAEKEEKSHYNRKSILLLRWGIFGFIISLVVAALLPIMVTHWTWGATLGVDYSNEIGDTIGGIMGPAVGLIGAALTFFAFWAQYDANLEQRRQFEDTIKKQRDDDKILQDRYKKEQNDLSNKYQAEQSRQQLAFKEQQKQFEARQKLQQEQILLQDKRTRLDLFESKFYTMLSIHRDNVNGMDVNNITGRKVFLHMIDELRFLYWLVKKHHDNLKKQGNLDTLLTETELYQIAYLSFFFGIDEKSSPLVTDLGGDKLKTFIEGLHAFINGLTPEKNQDGIEKYKVIVDDTSFEWENVRTLGGGHLRRLSHYIRHLFQTVKFVDEQSTSLLTDDEKYDYITNLRSQLSTYEQLLIYYNALSVLGQPWLTPVNDNTENYIVKYCLVKSMPINSADFYKKPDKVLPKVNSLGKPMFEWTEIRKRMQDLQ